MEKASEVPLVRLASSMANRTWLCHSFSHGQHQPLLVIHLLLDNTGQIQGTDPDNIFVDRRGKTYFKHFLIKIDPQLLNQDLSNWISPHQNEEVSPNETKVFQLKIHCSPVSNICEIKKPNHKNFFHLRSNWRN